MVPFPCFDQEFVRGSGAPVTESYTFPGITVEAKVMLWKGATHGVEKVSRIGVYINGEL
jgi:hypothetical protein